MTREELLNLVWEEQDTAYDLMCEYDGLPHHYGENILYQAEGHLIDLIALYPGITTTDLAGILKKTVSACSQLVHKMRKKGWIKQTRNENNNRQYNLELTESGQKVYKDHAEFSQNCQKITFDMLNEFSNDETAFLAIYFKSAMDRNRYKNKFFKKILVVCGHGYGTSTLLVQQLKEIYTIDIIKTIPRYLLEKTLQKEKIDLIISTVEIENNFSIPLIKVNSILTQEDINNLDRYSLSKQKKRYVLSELIELIERSCKIENEKREYNLSDFLTENSILINQKVESWEEAVRVVGEILVKNKITKVDYIDSMIKNIKNLGAYVVIGDKLAIPHAQTDKSVLKTGMGLITLKKPILFPNNREVQVLLAFSSLDGKEHLNALAEFAELVKNNNFIENILKAKTLLKILKYIKIGQKL